MIACIVAMSVAQPPIPTEDNPLLVTSPKNGDTVAGKFFVASGVYDPAVIKEKIFVVVFDDKKNVILEEECMKDPETGTWSYQSCGTIGPGKATVKAWQRMVISPAVSITLE
jgi:hypothetical protein